MIEREFVAQKTKEFYIKKHIENKLQRVGISQIRLKKIPLGEKIIIETGRPSLIVGKKGANIKDLTRELKKKFKLENPQIEINEIKDIFLDPHIVAERIAGSLERFGPTRFKGVGHKTMENVINSGALGVEIIISGKIPGARARNWRFYQGYLKKCGDISVSGVRKAQAVALMKSGIIGIKVAIMPPDVILPDNIKVLDEPIQVVEEVKEEKEKVKKKPKRKTATKKSKISGTSSRGKKKVKKEEKTEVVKEKVEKKEVKTEEKNPAEKEVLIEKAEELVEGVKEEVKHLAEGAEKVVGKVVKKIEEVFHIHEKKEFVAEKEPAKEVSPEKVEEMSKEVIPENKEE